MIWKVIEKGQEACYEKLNINCFLFTAFLPTPDTSILEDETVSRTWKEIKMQPENGKRNRILKNFSINTFAFHCSLFWI